MASKIIICTTEDGTKIEINEKAAEKSTLLKELFEGFSDNMEDTLIPHTDGPILKKVAEYLDYYTGKEPRQIPKPLPSASLAEVTDEWDINFMNSIQLDLVFDLINAANYFSIKPLLELACAKIASEMYGKTADEIREKFNIENDLDEEDMKEYEQFKI